jgi:tetratricopeptide (TPR) repeat protein
MNKTKEFTVADANARYSASGKFSDLQNIMKLALNSLDKGKYSLAIDYCRRVVNGVRESDPRELLVEAYRIWCISFLKSNKPDDARKVCYEARRKLGNYRDLVYLELLIAAQSGEIDKIPRYVENYLQLYDVSGSRSGSAGVRSGDMTGEVLLKGAQAKEQLNDPAGALEMYRKYISLFPDDKPVSERIAQLAGQIDLE